MPLAIIDRSSMASPGLLVPAFDHLRKISFPAVTIAVSVALIPTLFGRAFPSNAIPELVCGDVKFKAGKAVQVPAVKDVTVAPAWYSKTKVPATKERHCSPVKEIVKLVIVAVPLFFILSPKRCVVAVEIAPSARSVTGLVPLAPKLKQAFVFVDPVLIASGEAEDIYQPGKVELSVHGKTVVPRDVKSWVYIPPAAILICAHPNIGPIRNNIPTK